MQPSVEGRLLLAIEALKKDPKLTENRAAKLYDVPRTTLQRRRAGRPSRRDINPPRQRLTNLEESAIIDYIIDLDTRAFPPRLAMVEDMANRLLAERNEKPVGVNWASNFVRRQPRLKTRYNRRIDYERVKYEDPMKYRTWFSLVQNTIAKYGILESDIYNFDETGFALGIISNIGMVVTSAERRGRPRQAQQGNREWATVIQAVSAQGYAVPPYIIVAGKVLMTSWFEDTSLPEDWRITTTETGWITNEKGLDWI